MNRIYQSMFKMNKSLQLLPRCSYTKDPSPNEFIIKDAPGLSKQTVDVPSGEVGFPGASKSGCYKNPEYFCYHSTSYFDAEVEMQNFRLPQPSNKSEK